MTAPPTLSSGLDRALEGFCALSPLVIALDFDGVLAPLVDVPNHARLVSGAATELTALAGLAEVQVALVSGRALTDLAVLTDLGRVDAITLIGSHGAERSDADEVKLDRRAQNLLDRLRHDLEQISTRHPGTRIENKPTAVVLHTRGTPTAVAAEASTEALQGPATWPGVQCTPGKDVVELSVVPTGKGVAVQALRAQARARAVLYAGDDLTDERAFAVLDAARGDVGIKVGDGDSTAMFRVADPRAVVQVLARIRQLLS